VAAAVGNQDVYLVITEMIKCCKSLSLQFFHVMGHQDTKANCPLIMVTKPLNVEYDKNAKNYVTTTTLNSNSFGNLVILVAQPHLRIGGKIVCCKLLPTLQMAISTLDYYDYL